jgi:glycine/D-amino acid oxidase-like deaminating enzyme
MWSPPVSGPKVVIIGGGIAGLGCAWSLCESGNCHVTLLEREANVFAHASGRNAAIFRPLENSLALIALAARSRQLLGVLAQDARLLEEVGLLLTAAQPSALDSLIGAAKQAELEHRLVNEREIPGLNPLLAGGCARVGILLPHGGILDLRGIAEQLLRRSTARGVEVLTGSDAVEIETRAGRVSRVRLGDGRILEADRVVLATGAWAPELTQALGVDYPFLPHRRHLAYVECGKAIPAHLPVAWDVEIAAYLRTEGAGIVACPGDQTPHPAGIPEVSSAAAIELERKLRLLCPNLTQLEVKQLWACLRTLTPDEHPVLGPDPRLSGLHWLAGLGGHGMSIGLAASELVASALLEHREVPAYFSVVR